jgi:crotonobetainyl-CoA:carnitine CoA-transferase CaiB-like acyl-CoA transferase
VHDARFITNAHRVTNNDVLVQILQAKFSKQPSAHWLSALKKASIPAGPVLSFDEAMADPQIVARDMVVESDHPSAGKFRTLGVAAKLSRTPGALRRPAPRLGEHTDEVLSEAKRITPEGQTTTAV